MRRLAACVILLTATMAWATYDPKSNQPFPPHRIIGNVFYVGTNGLASYLITSDRGHILINPDYEESVPLIRDAVEKLGFRFDDIRLILISHAHDDHAAGAALAKELTHAKLMVMDGDAGLMENGGEGDFQYTEQRWKAVAVDRVLHDGDEVSMGGNVLTARLTAGHTRGCTTWTMKVAEGGRTYDVVIVGSPNVNPGYKLIRNQEYPNIASDYAETFKLLKSLPCDVFLGAHGSYYGLAAKYARLGKPGAANPFVDPAGYKAFVAERERAFLAEWKKQGGVVPGARQPH